MVSHLGPRCLPCGDTEGPFRGPLALGLASYSPLQLSMGLRVFGAGLSLWFPTVRHWLAALRARRAAPRSAAFPLLRVCLC